MASINWSTTALRDLDSLDSSIVERVIQKVQWLGENLEFITREPLHHDLKQVYKLRVSGVIASSIFCEITLYALKR